MRSTRLRQALTVAGLAMVVGAVPAAHAAQQASGWWTKDGATWTESYITEPDGTVLHADVLRPTGLPLNAKVPVIMTISPYLNHSGQTSAAGTYDPTGQQFSGPSNRFQDFIDGTQLFKHGYAYVEVDLRGEGGSTGCWDWGGPGEQNDVKYAVQWAASQPWSTGRVGMYGKSYDAGTGVMGEAMAPKGLDAIVAQEPVYDWYDYLYTNGVRFSNSIETPALFDAISATPGQATDTPRYNIDSEDSLAKPGCYVSDFFDQAADSNHDSPFWQQRNEIAESADHRIPFFLTQGFLENNTKPLGAWQFFNELKGPKHAWFDMSDHIRGNEVSEGDNAAPHPWFDQVMRFFNHFVKGEPLSNPDAATNRDPSVAVETSDGRWRAEQAWPPLDTQNITEPITPGTYTDGFNAADSEDTSFNDTTGVGDWTISPPFPYPAHYAGVPEAALDVTSEVPHSDLSVDVYDIHANGTAFLLSRTAYLLKEGEQQIYPELYGNDWLIAQGDRIGILVTSANDGWWSPTPTQTPVTINPGSVITLPFLKYTRQPSQNLAGYKTPARLGIWLKGAGTISLPASTITSRTSRAFVRPPAETTAPPGFNSGAYGLGQPRAAGSHH